MGRPGLSSEHPHLTKSSTSILPLFPLLSSHDPPTRLDASLSLLTALPFDATSSATTAIEDADTPYAIQRLVKGLASSNESSRQGFAVALTELLAQLPTKLSSPVLPLIITSSTPSSGSDSREEREMLFARLLGLHAVIRSGVLFRPSSTTGETFREVILALLALSGRKSWMKEPAFWVIVEGVRTLLELQGATVPEWKETELAWCLQRLINDSREKAKGFSAEKVALVLVLQAYGIEADYANILSPSFPTGNPLARSSLVSLAQALKGTTGEIESAAPQAKGPKLGSNAVKTSTKGTALTPGGAPHFVWSEIFEVYFPEAGKPVKQGLAGAKEGRAKWTEVWRVLVDQSLFAPTSLSLKSTGFSLLSLAIQRLPPFEVPALFGEGIIRTLSNHLRKSGDAEKTLARVAEKVASSLPTFLSTNSSVALPLLKALIAPPHGSHSFDSRTIEKIVAKLDVKGVRGWIKYLKDLVIGEEEELLQDGDDDAPVAEDEKTVTAKRVWAFDQLLHIAKATVVPKDDEILAGLLEFFAVLGWFQVRKSGKGARSYIPTPAFSETLNIAARSRFFSILTALPHTPSPSGQTWLSRALALLDNLAADDKHFNLIVETDEEAIEARKEVVAMYAKLGGNDERKRNVRVLIEGVLLVSYDEGEDALEALEQLTDCVAHLFPDLISDARKTAIANDDTAMGSDDDDDEEPESSTVLVDLLLELLHRPSAFVKGVAQTVFTGLSAELGEQAMDLLLDQIRPDEVDVVEEEEDDDAGDDEDSEMVNGDATASTSKAVTKSKSNGKKIVAPIDSDDDDESDDDAEVDEDFRNELLAALEANGIGDVFEEADARDDGDESEEELLDDDQMMALDEQLADIFRLQGGAGKKGKQAARTDDLHYRLRVVDLLDSLVKQRLANPLLVLVVLPLFSIAQRAVAVEEELQSKATKLLRLIVSSRKDPPSPADPQSSLDALAELHIMSRTVDSPELANLCSQACIYLVKSALASSAADASTSKAISTIYSDSFQLYLSRKNSKTRVQPALTIEFARRLPVCAWPMFASVVGLAGGEGANAFRRMQAFEVAQNLLSSYSALKTDEAKSHILLAMPSFRAAVYAVLSSPLADTVSSFDASRIKELVKIALAAVRITVSASSSSSPTLESIWNGQDFVELADRYKTSERFKGALAIQNLLRQLVTVVSGASASNGPSTKRKADAVTEVSSKDKKAKKDVAAAAVDEDSSTIAKSKDAKKARKEKKV